MKILILCIVRDAQHSTDNCSSMLKLGPNKKRPTDAPTAQTSPLESRPSNPKTEANSAEKHLVIDVRTNLISIYVPCDPSHCPMPGLHEKRIMSAIFSTLNPTPSKILFLNKMSHDQISEMCEK